MNKCLDKNELMLFLKGELDQKRLLSMDEHIGNCADCSALLASMPAVKKAAADLGSTLLSVSDCPEYEKLSAYVDGTLDEASTKAIQIHINACEPCYTDVERIQELRSQAVLRGKVTVRPGMSKRRERNAIGIWQRVLGGVVVAGAVAAVAVSFGVFNKADNKPVVAVAPKVKVEQTTPSTKPAPTIAVVPQVKPNVAQNPKTENTKPATQVARTYTTVLKDGAYRLIRKNGSLAYADASGNSIRTPLEARVWASIQEKLKTGKIRTTKSIQVAMAPTTLRGDGEYTPPTTAPKLLTPINNVVLNNYPTFKWSDVDLAESYRVIIASQNGTVVFEGNTDKNSLTLSQPLQRGQVYNWQVGARFSKSDPWSNSSAARFTVLSSEDFASIQRIKSTLPSSHLALGAIYESLGLQNEAASEYKALLRDNPTSSLARRLASE